MATKRGTSAADKLNGTSGNDKLYGLGGKDTIDGGAGNDLIVGGKDADVMLGGKGNDTFDLETAANAKGDRVDGGAGTDSLVVSFAGTATAVNFAAVAPTKTGSLGSISYTGIERFDIIGSDGNDDLMGGAGADRLSGGAGNDHLRGVKGNNLLQTDHDILDGGAGNDLIEFDSATFGGDTVIGGKGNDTLKLHWAAFGNFIVDADGTTKFADGTTITGIENYSIETDWTGRTITTRGGNDHISSGLNDILDSGAGNDTIEAWHGSDKVNAGAGNDLVAIRYDGKDVVDGGLGTDTVRIDAGVTYRDENNKLLPALGNLDFSASGVTAKLVGGTSAATYSNFEVFDIITGKGDDSISVTGALRLTANAGAGNDTLRGGTADDVLNGGSGNDGISGGGGQDVMYGGSGNDTITLLTGGDARGGSGTDTVIVDYRTATTGLDFTFNQDTKDYTYTDADTGFLGIESMYVRGSSLTDVVVGGKGADVLEGNGGNDVLRGGGGIDTIAGGAGSDIFAYVELYTSAQADTITDFVAGTDKLQFSRSTLGLAAGELPDLIEGTRTVGGGSQFVFDGETGRLWYDADGSGGNAAIRIAELVDTDSLAISDFMFV